jgi:hypothetical protein
MSRHYKIGDKKLASVTTIISDCTDKSGALCQWSANMVCAWIRENCKKRQFGTEYDNHYTVFESQLEEARFNFRDVSKEALDIGSAVHNAIEYYLNTGKEPEWLK